MEQLIEGCSKGCGWIKHAVSEPGRPTRTYTCAGHYLDDESRLFHVAGSTWSSVHAGITAMWSDDGLVASWSQPWLTPAMARVAWGAQHDPVALEEWTTAAEQLRKLVATLETSNSRHEKSRMSTDETQQ